MPLITCEQLLPDKIQNQVRARHQEAMRILRALGFEELGFFGVTLFPFSFLLLLPVLLSMLRGGVIKIKGFLRLVIITPLLVNREEATYAEISRREIKFGTSFADEKLVSTTPVPRPGGSRPDSSLSAQVESV